MRWFMENISKSLYFDLRTLLMRQVSISEKVIFLICKYRALLSTVTFGSSRLRIRENFFSVASISDIGTIHSSIVDFYDDIVRNLALPDEAAPKIVDIGANIGQFSNAALFFFPGAHIIAFEPDPVIAAQFKRNINRDVHDVTIHEVGLGEATSELAFYRNRLSVRSSFVEGDPAETNDKVHLKVEPLDGFDLHDLSLVKIDVEGFECEVLLGAKRTLAESKLLLIELSLSRETEKRNLDILKVIQETAEGASIVKFGRPLGEKSRPSCQDVLIDLTNDQPASELATSRRP
jgi:FkbM family methyltransferase